MFCHFIWIFFGDIDFSPAKLLLIHSSSGLWPGSCQTTPKGSGHSTKMLGFKQHLDYALKHRDWFWVVLYGARGSTWWSVWVCFSLRYSMVSWFYQPSGSSLHSWCLPSHTLLLIGTYVGPYCILTTKTLAGILNLGVLQVGQ